MQQAANLFTFNAVCHVNGTTALPLTGPHFALPPLRDVSPMGDTRDGGSTPQRTRTRSGPNRQASPGARRLQADGADAAWARSLVIKDRVMRDLRLSQRLPGYEPMSPYCPLIGRKVVAAAVSEIAALAWHCEGGCGFADDCLA